MKKVAVPLMRPTSVVAMENANPAPAASFARNEKSFGLLVRLSAAIRAAWPTKPEKHAAHFTGKTERAVQFWLAGSTRMSVEDVAALLRTDEGFLILDAIIGDDCDADWWMATKNAYELRMTRKQIEAAQRKLDAVRQRQMDLFNQA